MLVVFFFNSVYEIERHSNIMGPIASHKLTNVMAVILIECINLQVCWNCHNDHSRFISLGYYRNVSILHDHL
jgi:hypothetical protein